MADGSNTSRSKGRRISFSSIPATVVVTESNATEISPELRASAEHIYEQKGDVLIKDVPSMLESLGFAGSVVDDLMLRQKVIPPGQMYVSQTEFVNLAAATQEFSQEVGTRPAASSRALASGLTASLQDKLQTFFARIDKDGSGSVTLDEAINFWGNNFAKVNATAMFKEVDSDGDGSITFDEWIGFWVNVVQHGYAPDELEEEVEMLLEGNSWVDFNDGRTTGADAGQ